jgi:hypothetical protein
VARLYGMRTKHLAMAAVMLLLVVVAVVKWAGGPDHGKVDRPAIPVGRSSHEASPEATARPGSGLELPSRGLPGTGGDPFFAPSRAQPPAQPQAVPRDAPAPVLPPQAPPLPFTYLGRIRSGGTTTVFLGRQNGESVARVGNILDDTYRVERIDEDRLVLVYLPLGTQQTLLFAPEGAMARSAPPGGRTTAQTPGDQEASALHLDAPEQVSTGQDFVVNLSLLAGRKASVGVLYDPNVLSAIRRPAAGDSTLSDRGRVLVDVVGPGFAGGAAAPTAVRFRVVGAAPATTQIQVEYLSTSHDSDLESLTPPAPRRIFVSAASAQR